MSASDDPLVPSPDVLVAHLAGEAVLLHVVTKRYFQLNATGAEIWRGMEAGEGTDAIVARLLGAFEVSDAAARAELARFAAGLRDAGLLADPRAGDR